MDQTETTTEAPVSTDIMALLSSMAFIIIYIVELSLSTIPILILAFAITWLSDPKSRFKRKTPELGPLGMFLLTALHCLVVFIWYFLNNDKGVYQWWWVLLGSVLGIWAVTIGIGMGIFIIAGFVRAVKMLATSAPKATQYAPVAADEHELEEGTAKPSQSADKADSKE